MKKVNKTKAKSARVRAFTAAQRNNLSTVRTSAFDAGQSRGMVVRAVQAACGGKPVLTLYNAVKLELQIGFMASALARKGDNRAPTELFDDCRTKITLYQGHGGTGKLRKGSKGRRNAVEEAAYGSARVQVTGIMKEAGVRVPETRGGNTSSTRNAKKGANAKRNTSAANENKPIVRKYRNADALIEYAHVQGKAMLATINKNAGLTDPRLSELRELVAGFASKVAAII